MWCKYYSRILNLQYSSNQAPDIYSWPWLESSTRWWYGGIELHIESKCNKFCHPFDRTDTVHTYVPDILAVCWRLFVSPSLYLLCLNGRKSLWSLQQNPYTDHFSKSFNSTVMIEKFDSVSNSPFLSTHTHIEMPMWCPEFDAAQKRQLLQHVLLGQVVFLMLSLKGILWKPI